MNKKKNNPYDRAYWFSEQLRADSKLLDTRVSSLLDLLYEHSQLKRKRYKEHLPQLRTLVLNLLKASQTKPPSLTIPMSSDSYTAFERVSFKVLVKHHVETLVAMGWLSKHSGFRYGEQRRLTRLELLEPMLKWLKNIPVNANDIERPAPKSSVLVKDENKNVIQLPAAFDEELGRRQRRLNQVNEAFAKSFFDLFLSENELEDLDGRMLGGAELDPDQPPFLDLSAKYLTRIFNNSSLEQGGRFYRGWWQNIPKEFRPLICINGDFTTEMDYSAIHPTLLYALEGKEMPYEDPYVCGLLTEELRSVTKRAFNILFNAADREQAVKAIRNQSLLQNSSSNGFHDEQTLIDLIYDSHSLIGSYFGSGYGVKLQYLDSEIAEAVMLRMLPEPCLPVHDSFIVRVGQTSKLKQIMDEEFEAATGVKAGIKIKLLELSDDRKRIVNELIDDELSGFSIRLNKWRKKHHWKFFVDGGTAYDVPQLTGS